MNILLIKKYSFQLYSKDKMTSAAAKLLGISDDDTHIVLLSTTEIQLCKKQDYTVKGSYKNDKTGEQFEWLALFDGHGDNTIINKIRNLDLTPFVISENPPIALQDYITKSRVLSPWNSSGATMCLAKVYKDHIKTFTVGDSQLIIYQDDKVVYKNKLHKWENIQERERLFVIDPLISLTPSNGFKIVSNTTMIDDNQGYIRYGNGRMLAVSQAIGHNNITGICPEIFTLPIKTGSIYRVLMASDGVFDVLIENEEETLEFSKNTSDEIAYFAENRWKQKWFLANPDDNFKPIPGTQFKFGLPSQFDDISVGTIDIVPF
jgi:serine/threonine protein phosphatase PrpC